MSYSKQCALDKVRAFLASQESSLFARGSKYFGNYRKEKLYIFITYTRCDNFHGVIDVPTHPHVWRRETIRHILTLLLTRTPVPLARLCLYAVQPASFGIRVAGGRYHVHQKCTLALVEPSFTAKVSAVVKSDPGFAAVPGQSYTDLWCCSTAGCTNHRLPLQTLCYTHLGGSEEYHSFAGLHSYGA
jgi:hypothetical protein